MPPKKAAKKQSVKRVKIEDDSSDSGLDVVQTKSTAAFSKDATVRRKQKISTGDFADDD